MTTKCLPKRQDLKKIKRKYNFSRPSEKENPWSEDETDTGTTTEANEPIEVDDDVSHEASENKEQGKFQSRWASLYTWLTYDTAHWSKQYYNSCLLPLELLKIIFGPGGDLCPQFLWGSCCSIFSFMCSVM